MADAEKIKVRVWIKMDTTQKECVYEFDADEWAAMGEVERQEMVMEYIDSHVRSGYEVAEKEAARA